MQQQKGVDKTLSTEEWGWKSCEGLLVPVMTHLPLAPEALLHVIRCTCSTDCSSLRCSWRKNNLEWSPVCGQCRGSACTTSLQPEETERSSEDEDDSWFVSFVSKLSALTCLRDDFLYFKKANRVLIKTIYKKYIKICCFVFSLDFMLTLKTLFYLEKYQFSQVKPRLMIHPYLSINCDLWTIVNCWSKKYIWE